MKRNYPWRFPSKLGDWPIQMAKPFMCRAGWLRHAAIMPGPKVSGPNGFRRLPRRPRRFPLWWQRIISLAAPNGCKVNLTQHGKQKRVSRGKGKDAARQHGGRDDKRHENEFGENRRAVKSTGPAGRPIVDPRYVDHGVSRSFFGVISACSTCRRRSGFTLAMNRTTEPVIAASMIQPRAPRPSAMAANLPVEIGPSCPPSSWPWLSMKAAGFAFEMATMPMRRPVVHRSVITVATAARQNRGRRVPKSEKNMWPR